MSKTLTYLFDSLCGWYYNTSPALASIVESTGVGLELLPTGLFAGHGVCPMDMSLASYAWTNDQRIEEITGQTLVPGRDLSMRTAPGASF